MLQALESKALQETQLLERDLTYWLDRISFYNDQEFYSKAKVEQLLLQAIRSLQTLRKNIDEDLTCAQGMSLGDLDE